MTDLDVLLHGRLAGTVSEGRGSRATFVYNDEYLASTSPVPLSVSIPLGEGAYEVEAWLDGLLSDTAGRIGDLSERIVDAFTEAIDTLPARARALPCVADLRQGVSVRSIEGMNVSKLGAKAPQKHPKNRSVSVRSSPLDRCTHIGVRSRERCKLTKGHRSAHRYH